jgi:predicted AlkP superfamily phosphohydrolase/phosphomutase
MDRRRRSQVLLHRAAAAILVTLAIGCAHEETPPRPKLVVIGIDGGDPQVLERRWNEGGLPNLRSLADRGVVSPLGTAWTKSPVIWTTIATGVAPPRHGITDFVVPTPRGDVPVSSDVRRVPALWNIASRAGLRVAVLGWWASWPAETVNGVVVSDRAVPPNEGVAPRLERRAFPPALDAELDGEIARAREDPRLILPREGAGLRDRTMAHLASRLAREDYDLLMVYFRTPDIVSHSHWKEYEPDAFGGRPPANGLQLDPVSEVYEQVDQAIGQIVAAAGPDADVLVVSDHGFRALVPEQVTVVLDLDVVLERFGLLSRSPDGGVDLERSAFYTYASWAHRSTKLVRFGGAERDERTRSILRQRLERELAAATWSTGEPAFRARDAKRAERDRGADLVVRVLDPPPGSGRPELRWRGETVNGAVLGVSSLSGTHTHSTYGIFLAAGPHIDPGADLAGVRVHDLAPTILYALGLPVANDFVGRARLELFTPQAGAALALRTVATYGNRDAVGATTSPLDERILDELEALGYLP